MTSPLQEPPEQKPLTDEQKAEQYAREIRQLLEAVRAKAADAAQLALHHQHSEAGRRYVQLAKHLEFAEKILGHAEAADLRGYPRTEE
jgi:hypothetical protein